MIPVQFVEDKMKKLGNVLGAPAKMRVSALGRQRSVCSRTIVGKLGWAAAILLLLLTATGGTQSTPALAQSNPTTQIGFILDGSGSIRSDNWTTITAGLAEALRNPMCVPQDGSVEFTLTVFGHGADVLIPHETIEDDGMANRIADFVERLDYPDESTNIAEGLVQTANAMRDSPNFSPELKQAVNLVTDGAPNGTTDGTTCNENDPVDVIPCQRNTEEAREYLLETLEMTPDQDELDSEFIGAPGAT
ncbi:MAG: VWA domain-containing protein, partial [Caldilineaceae bacterium]|nr:VWA domain-containing protein [Caldilineaceae bacterium]